MNRFDIVIFSLILLSFTVVPEFFLIPGIPQIKLIDVLMPFMFYRIYQNRRAIHFPKFYLVLSGYLLYILFTILINDHKTELNEYFELYKIFKLGIVICFVSLINFKFETVRDYFFAPLFILVFIFNALHYYNVFNINDILEVYYNGGIHIQNFGLNSIGGEATKRLVGTIGNPNNNAILLLFFIFIFYPGRNNKKWHQYFFFFLATLLFFLCQSRTGFIALFAVMALIVIMELINWKSLQNKWRNSAIIGCIFLTSFSIAYLMSSNFESSVYPPLTQSEKTTDTTEMQPNVKEIYLNTLFTDNVLENNSLKGRFEIWQELWVDIKIKPVFGHGPNKNYFYENELYAESGFFLMAYRYGIVGLLFYLLSLFYLFCQGIKYKDHLLGALLWQITVVVAVTSLTNIPLGSRELLAFFGVVLGLFLSAKYNVVYGKEQ